MCKQNEIILLKELNKMSCDPSTTALSRQCNFGHYQIKDYLQNLEDKGYIKSEEIKNSTYWKITERGIKLLKC